MRSKGEPAARALPTPADGCAVAVDAVLLLTVCGSARSVAVTERGRVAAAFPEEQGPSSCALRCVAVSPSAFPSPSSSSSARKGATEAEAEADTEADTDTDTTARRRWRRLAVTALPPTDPRASGTELVAEAVLMVDCRRESCARPEDDDVVPDTDVGGCDVDAVPRGSQTSDMRLSSFSSCATALRSSSS